MKIPTLKLSGILHASRKERSISLATAQVTWFSLIIIAATMLLVGGGYAMYVFTHIDQTGESVIVDPPQTVSYKGARIDAVLERYRAKAKYFGSTTITEVPESTESTPDVLSDIASTTVATTTVERVE